MSIITQVQQTVPTWWPLVPRVAAGLPLVYFSLLHFINPGHFREILLKANVPLVEVNVVAASTAELLAGVLILAGLFTRIGGFLGLATMIPAIIATVQLASIPDAPKVPPLPLPIAISVLSLLLIWVGGGSLSVDGRMTQVRGQR